MSLFGASNHFANDLNAEVLERGDRKSTFRYQTREGDLNALGVIHGGMLAGLMDLNGKMRLVEHPLHLALVTARDSAAYHDFVETLRESGFGFRLTVNMHINFVAEAKAGTLTCRAWEVGGGRKTVFAEGRIEDEDGNLVATGTGAFKLLPPGSEQEIG